jgi:hypothetical protein
MTNLISNYNLDVSVSVSLPTKSEQEKRQPSLAKLRPSEIVGLVLVVSAESVAHIVLLSEDCQD